MTRTPILIIALLALVLAACGSDQPSPSPTTEATLGGEPTAEPTAEPTEDAATPEPTPDDASGFSGSLSDALPDEVGGLSRVDLSGMDAFIGPALAQSGMDAEDAEYVVAIWGEGDRSVMLTGLRTPGMDRPQLEMLANLITGSQTGGEVSADTVTVGGKTVLRMSGTEMPDAAYLYFTGDAFFTVISESADLAEELLSQLP